MLQQKPITLEELKALAPWHFNVPVSESLSTADANTGENQDRPMTHPGELLTIIQKIYPQGLQGKRCIDAACNGGAYSLSMSALGAEYVFGFDVRDCWINQANFLKERMAFDFDNVRFELADLMEIEKHLEPNEEFDICIFKGIFYHLPDPVAGLKKMTDRTRELIIVDSDTSPGHEDGFLKFITEGTINPMSGVHEIAWLPTGPKIIQDLLKSLGFSFSKVIFNRKPGKNASEHARGRVRVVASRQAHLLENTGGDL